MILNVDPGGYNPVVASGPSALAAAFWATAKTAKNRLHLDFRDDDQRALVDRFLAHGATRIDIGQGDSPWVVLADPEDNEFCVLASRADQAK
ncbi:glyoxalase/bleomycin resistance protein/dioxygenase [Mycobacteroides abscessus subsp. abscessus]|nr:glyoxalase/bleomycin resistance protein/dioxygenase [Mycobacteroides abscessus subsp. abscessus]